MQLNPLYVHEPHVVVVVDTEQTIIPEPSRKWTWIALCVMLMVDVITVLVAYLLTGSFDNWFKYFMAGNAIFIGLAFIFCLIDYIQLSCRKN
jgi:hypothetical protein